MTTDISTVYSLPLNTGVARGAQGAAGAPSRRELEFFFFGGGVNLGAQITRAVRKSRIHDRRDYRDFRRNRDFWP